MNPTLLLDLLGYLGMAIVIASFFMTNMKWLRVVNMTGGSICFIYGLLTNTIPTAALNIILVFVNGFHLTRTLINERKEKESVGTNPDNNEKKEENV